MIPKIIHFCWLSNDPFPASIKKCIDSWKDKMPDYQIKLWSTENFNVNSVPLVKEAFETKKYAFAADYIRCYALYTDGGVYLDSDVLVHKNFDHLLDGYDFVSGLEFRPSGQRIYNKQVDILGYRKKEVQEVYGIGVQAAIMASVPHHPLMKRCIDFYSQSNLSYILEHHLLAPIVQCKAMEEYGFKYKNEIQKLKGGIILYSTSVFGQGKDEIKGRYASHLGAGSWVTKTRYQKFIAWAIDVGLYVQYMRLKDFLGLIK